MDDNPNKPPSVDTDTQLAALSSLQDWSKWLVGIDAGVLGLVTFGVKDLAEAAPNLKMFLTGALICFCMSLIIATWLVGAVPAFIMRLKTGDQPNRWWINCKEPNIYDFTYGGIRVQEYAFLQHLTFIFGAVLLTTALIVGLC